ncbi:MAG: hypothetical protein HQK49_12605 [Oligoflexia bacterium]|nr:hypothetical protein [Oligoflexia bacterium]
MKTVIPFYPEAIINSDGDTKNDCEKNAAKRFIVNLKEDHPKLNLIVVADSLYSDTVFIALLKRSQLSYVLNAKPGKLIKTAKRLFGNVLNKSMVENTT